MPPGYYRQLPKLKNSPYQGDPRIYTLARELLTFDNYQMDAEEMPKFIQAYQAKGASLSMGELWAFPIMLRLVTLNSLANTLT